MVALNTTEGMALIYDSATLRRPYGTLRRHYRQHHALSACLMFALHIVYSEEGMIHFATQQDTSSCGRASATLVLNALAGAGIPAPIDDTYGYPYWTQDMYTSSDCVASNW